MLRPALPAVLCLYCLLLVLPARAALDDQQRALQQLQVQACRAVGSLLLLRGEGFQEQHAAQLEKDLASLDRALAAAPEGVLLRQDEKTLVARIREGAAYGPREEDLPWRYPQQLSRALRDFLNLVERQVPPPRQASPCRSGSCRCGSSTCPCNTWRAPTWAGWRLPASSPGTISARTRACWFR